MVSDETKYNAMLREMTELLVDPFINYLHDRIDDGSNVLYVLEKYKRRTAWATQIQNPQNRVEAVRGQVEALGGSIEQAWYAFGEYDLVGILQMPDNVNMAAIALALQAGGHVKAAKTTPLMTIEEGLEAMQKAGDLDYSPPSAG